MSEGASRPLYQVYLLTFVTVRGTPRRYVGMTCVHGDEAPAAALCRRRRWHLKRPVAWLKCADLESVHLESVGVPQQKDRALADEAIEAARLIAEDPRRCRGGPWCLPGERGVLPPRHEREVRLVRAAVAAASSLTAQRAALRQVSGRALAAHLRGASFVDDDPPRVRKKAQASGHENRKKYNSSVRAERRYVRSAAGKAAQRRRNARRRAIGSKQAKKSIHH